MVDLFLERRFDSPLTVEDVHAKALKAGSCAGLYRVSWVQSLLQLNGRQMFCHFNGPDTESLRMVLRQSGSEMGTIWTGSIHESPAVVAPNVVVARRFDQPVTLEAIQAIEDAGSWCLDAHQVSFVRTYFSLDRRRMICLYRGPDAESVRAAQQQAAMPFDAIWSYRTILPEHLTGNA